MKYNVNNVKIKPIIVLPAPKVCSEIKIHLAPVFQDIMIMKVHKKIAQNVLKVVELGIKYIIKYIYLIILFVYLNLFHKFIV